MYVQKLKINNKTQWKNLYSQYAEFYNMPMTNDILEKVWSWIFDKEVKFYAIGVLSDKDELIGIMHFREMPSPLRGTFVGFLDDLYVHPNFRGSGAVQLLFKELKLIANQNNWPYLRWITSTDNYRARKVYDKLSKVIDFVTYQMKCN